MQHGQPKSRKKPMAVMDWWGAENRWSKRRGNKQFRKKGRQQIASELGERRTGSTTTST